MRLIDADKLEPSETYIGFDFVRFVYMDDIDEMPTVSAIPIDWIEKQLKTVCDNIEAEMFGKWLIKEWEKENEHNRLG